MEAATLGRTPPRSGPVQVGLVASLLAVAAAAWALTGDRMGGMDAGPGTELGGPGWFAVVWVTMMAAMMLPSIAPIVLAHAHAAARALGRGDLLARAALGFGGIGITIRRARRRRRRPARGDPSALDDDHPALRARVLARLSVELYYAPPPARRETLSERAVALARDAGAADTVADVLSARHIALWTPITSTSASPSPPRWSTRPEAPAAPTASALRAP
jgi:hypothetical protein